MSEIDTTGTGDQTKVGQAKQALGQAGEAIKAEAQSFADAAQQRALEEAQKRTETATRTLGDFANAVRKAGDELGQADQGPAARLVRQAADGLENISRGLEGKRPEELLNDVRDFGRRNPAAFIGGAVLVGVALGRFLRASETTPVTKLANDGGDAFPLAETTAYGAAYGSLPGDDLTQPTDLADSRDATLNPGA